MKKFVRSAITFAALISLGLAGCGKNEEKAEEKQQFKSVNCDSYCKTEEQKKTFTAACANIANTAKKFSYTVDIPNSKCVSFFEHIMIWTPSHMIRFTGNPTRMFIADVNIIDVGTCIYIDPPETRRNIKDYQCK